MSADRSGVAVRTRVKICGITRSSDAAAAAQLGADAIGLVFYAPSPRAVDIGTAVDIVRVVPPFVTVVGLFVDAEVEYVAEVLRAVPLDVLQFHGSESPQYCGAFGRRFVKAVAMRDDVDLNQQTRRYHDASALLLDTHSDRLAGGTGQTFDWSRALHVRDMPVILAGGLSPDNVVEAVRVVRPYAVDVNSGVESAKGVKDHKRMEAVIRGVASVKT